ncbi:MAG: hypothetical protein JW864_10415 [Spirochaetes bacterium]|nr:hypothetical protein [Spirochaetota bacterium]
MKIKKSSKIIFSMIIILASAVTVNYLINISMLGKVEKSGNTDLDYTVFIEHSIESPKNINYTFNFIRNNLSEVYTDIAKGHKYFRIRNGGELKVGSVIDCSEEAGNQSVTHEYHVTDLVKNKKIGYYSEGSKVSVELPWETIQSKSNTYVYYDFTDTGNDTTVLKLTIGIQFTNSFDKFLSVSTGGIIPWEKHCIEEMEGLKRVLSKS